MATMSATGEARILSSRLFGPFRRYKLTRMATRFGSETWIVEDAESPDEFGMPAVIRQAESETEALRGLDHEQEEI